MEGLDCITLSPTYAYCMLCSGGVTELKWTERFKACKSKVAQTLVQHSDVLSRSVILELCKSERRIHLPIWSTSIELPYQTD